MSDVDSAAGTLRSRFDPESGLIAVEVAFDQRGLPAGSRVALTSLVQLTPSETTDAELVEQLASYHELRPRGGRAVSPDATWTIADLRLSHSPNHANDGPVSAFVVWPDGSTSALAVEPMTRLGDDALASPAPESDLPLPLPSPRSLQVLGDPTAVHATASITADAPSEATSAWIAVGAMLDRLGCGGRFVAAGGLSVEFSIDSTIDASTDGEAYSINVDDSVATILAAGAVGFRHALVTLAQWLIEGVPARAEVDDRPHYAFRGLHIDLARQWFEPAVVLNLIDVAAWRKLSHLHLHLSDDEGWRIPVEGYPELAEVGGTRGFGLPLPPMLGGGADRVGRVYTPDEIAAWVARADALGVELVPEIDLPAHVHAVLTALPQLRDPDDTSRARSVQYFTDNVLVPGHPGTMPFVTAVVDAVVDLFPNSPIIHIGGDEVPEGAWRGSPIAAAYRSEHGLGPSTLDIEAGFHRQLVALIRQRTGRRIGAWQEAAESGGVMPGDGYVVGWRTVEASRQLAAKGYDVVVSPGQAYYLDMASDHAWDCPGMTWAGTTTLDDVRRFDPAEGWSEEERAHLLGIQACLWTEHVRSPEIMQRLLFPRLDAVAQRAWSG